MSLETKAALDTALANHVADECDGALHGYSKGMGRSSTPAAATTSAHGPTDSHYTPLVVSSTTPFRGMRYGSWTLSQTRTTKMTDVYCAECDRPCASRAAADACAEQDRAEDREARIRRSTN